jgi:hypothetical protein
MPEGCRPWAKVGVKVLGRFRTPERLVGWYRPSQGQDAGSNPAGATTRHPVALVIHVSCQTDARTILPRHLSRIERLLISRAPNIIMALPDPVWVNDAPPRVDRRQVRTGRQEPLAAQSGPPWSMRIRSPRPGAPPPGRSHPPQPVAAPRQQARSPASRLQDLGLRPTRKPEEPHKCSSVLEEDDPELASVTGPTRSPTIRRVWPVWWPGSAISDSRR